MTHSLHIALLGGLSTSLVLAIAFLQISGRWGHLSYIRYWAFALAFWALRLGAGLISPVTGLEAAGIIAEFFHGLTSLFILLGSLKLVGQGAPKLLVLLYTVLIAGWISISTVYINTFWIKNLPLYVISSGMLFLSARVFYILHRRQPGTGYGNAAIAASIWAFHKLDYPWLGNLPEAAPAGFLFTQTIFVYLTVSLIMISLNRQKGLVARLAYRAAYNAEHDLLTGLPNRKAFQARLSRQIHKGGRIQVLILDIRNFRQINDAWGRKAADDILREVADRLSLKSGSSGFVSRLGGKEFAVLSYQGMNGSDLAGRILSEFKRPVEIQGRHIRLEMKIGSAVFPDDAGTTDEIIRNAGTALSDARVSGIRHRMYAELKSSAALSRMELQRDFFSAIQLRQLHVVYQPQFSIKTGRITGAEALVRWQHPKYGTVSPDVFIPLAEAGEQINALGDFVFTQILTDIKKYGWPQNIRIAMNLSPRQFTEENLIHGLMPLLENSGIDSSRIEFEITENALFYDENSVLSLIHKLHERGIILSIDDFGTGYSSLNMIKRLPVDRIKIDRSFVRDMLISDSDRAMVEMMIMIGHSFKLEVIAEGVEEEGQLEQLRLHNCDIVQGYLTGKPVHAEELTAMLKTRSA